MTEKKPIPMVERWKTDRLSVEATSQCCCCKHIKKGFVCDAFPEGIPDEIQDNVFIHKEPYEGDHGIQFEAESPEYENVNFRSLLKKKFSDYKIEDQSE